MTHGRLGRPRPGGRKRDWRRAFAEIAPHFRLERALAQSPSSHGVGRGPSPEVICRGIRPKPREIGIPEVIYGESRPSPPRSRAGRSSQMAGNGTYATLWMEIDYVPIRLPVSGANWRRTNHMRTSRRADGLRTGPDRGWGRGETGMERALPASNRSCAPLFRRNGAKRGDATGVERARRGRADRVAGPEVRICSIPSQKGAFSGPPIGTWSVSRQPALPESEKRWAKAR